MEGAAEQAGGAAERQAAEVSGWLIGLFALHAWLGVARQGLHLLAGRLEEPMALPFIIARHWSFLQRFNVSMDTNDTDTGIDVLGAALCFVLQAP